MKLNAIKKLCLAAENFEVIEAPGCQWIGDGRHYYRVYGARLMIDELDKLLGVKAEKACACNWNEYDRRDGDDWRDALDAAEPILTPVGDVWGWDQQILALEFDGAVLYVCCDALDALTPADRQYRLRRTGGRAYVACYYGMVCDALLSPLDATDAAMLTAALGRIAGMPVWGKKKSETEEAT